MVFKFYHGVDGLIRNEDDQKEKVQSTYSSCSETPVDCVYSVNIFHPDVIEGGDELVIDKLYQMQIHNLPHPPWLLGIQ